MAMSQSTLRLSYEHYRRIVGRVVVASASLQKSAPHSAISTISDKIELIRVTNSNTGQEVELILLVM